MAQYHKVDRPYLGASNPVLNDLAKSWRSELSLEDRVLLARGLWDTNIFEARVAAAKLLTQARIKPDAMAWSLVCTWVPQFDSWAIADHACTAIQKRLVADPARLDTVAEWTRSDHMWTRRAALVSTLPWAKLNTPKPHEFEQRERILGWAAGYTSDPDWFIQKSVAWWLRDLSKRAPDRVRSFLDDHGTNMKAFARKEAARFL
jgi:3-methyladenine DNA glycosylase AlkD